MFQSSREKEHYGQQTELAESRYDPVDMLCEEARLKTTRDENDFQIAATIFTPHNQRRALLSGGPVPVPPTWWSNSNIHIPSRQAVLRMLKLKGPPANTSF